MRFIHITDPHLTTPPSRRSLLGRSHYGKRFLGHASWSRNRRYRMRREWLDEVQGELLGRRPDQILLTGDLTQIGTREEILEARAWLESLGPPEQVCLAPGNHDTYAAESWQNLLAEWGDYLPEGGTEGFPMVRRIGDVLLLSVSSAVPTRPISACGFVGAAQLERLRSALAGSDHLLRVLMLHHPPLPGMIQFRKRLRDAAHLEQALGPDGVDLIFYGHRHRNRATERLGARLFCTAPASAENGAFRQLDIESMPGGWQLEQNLVARAGSGRFETIETHRWQVSGRA